MTENKKYEFVEGDTIIDPNGRFERERRLAMILDHYHLRMATPQECAEAGIEYIEPPMMWRDIESVPSDKPVIG